MKFYDKKKLSQPLHIKIAPRGYGKLKFVLETVEKLYSEAYLTKTNTPDMVYKREGKIEAYREVLKLLRAVINE